MAKLYFRYGVVGAAKTLNLLAVRHNYEHQGKSVMLFKPDIDDRYGRENVTSRSGMTYKADVLLTKDGLPLDVIESMEERKPSCILVDEAQFLSEIAVDELREIATLMNIPVICYGLRTDFQSRLFPGSKRLLEVSDSIEEVKNTCKKCNSKAVFNMRVVNGKQVRSGPQVLIGGDESYIPVCSRHYYSGDSDVENGSENAGS